VGIAWRNWLARPEWLWLLAVLPALGLLGLWARRRRREALARLGGGMAFADALTRSRKRGPWMFLCLWVGLMLVAITVAGPQWGRDWNQSATRGRDLVIVMDLSRSMLAEQKSRLERAKEAALDLVAGVRERGGHRLALVLFAGHAKLACPLTHDYDHVRKMIADIDGDYLDSALWPEDEAPSGTRIGEGLMVAVEAHSEEAAGVQDIILLSDGDDPGEDDEWRHGIDAAREKAIPIHTVGIGDPEKKHPIPFSRDRTEVLYHDGDKVLTRYEEKPLREIADRTKGQYVPLGTSAYPLGELYLSWIATGREHEHRADMLPVYHQRAAWFLTPAVVLLALSLFLDEGRRLRAV
jgi:Ca-activated chloride channel family protein